MKAFEKSRQSEVPRVLVTLIGDIEREPAAVVKYGHFINALREEFPVEAFDAALHGLPRLLNGLSVFHTDIQIWKQRFYQNLDAFRRRSRKAAGRVAAQEDGIDLVLQIGVLFDSLWTASDVPLYLYTDYTGVLSHARPDQGRSPFSEEDYRTWFELEKAVYEKADQIFTRGRQTRDSISSDYGISLEKISAVGGGVNFDPLPENVEPGCESNSAVLFIGREFYRKGGDLVLEAFQTVRKQCPEAQLWMVTELPDAVDYDMAGVSIIEPTWNREVIRSLYERAACFILPSRLETWGDVLLEAMAYCLPCVGVRDEAIVDIIVHEQTGLVVPPEDCAALSDALCRLFENVELRERYGSAARERVEQYFTWNRVVRRMSDAISGDSNLQ